MEQQLNSDTIDRSAQAFYDRLAADYDGMIDFDRRLPVEKEILRTFVEEFGIRTAADMGCGTGLHTLALAELGVDAIGVDISAEMLARAQAHAAVLSRSASTSIHGNDDIQNPVIPSEVRRRRTESREGSGAHFFQGDLLAPELKLYAPFDAVFCLGNTLPHIASVAELVDVLSHWKSCLSPEGIIVVQLLNYDRVFRERERIVGIRRAGEIVTVRFYDFTEPRITFNILSIQESAGKPAHALRSTLLTPFTAEDIGEAASIAGLSVMKRFGSLNREGYGRDSKDLVMVLYVSNR